MYQRATKSNSTIHIATYSRAATLFTFQGQLDYAYISLQTEKALCGEHTSPPPLQILSGSRKLVIDNKFLKTASRYIYTATEEDYVLPLGFLGIRQREAMRLFAATVPKLTMAMLTFYEKLGLQSSFIHRQSRIIK